MAESGNRAGKEEQSGPWLRTGFVLAAAFIGFVAVIGAVVVFSADSSAKDGGADAASSAPPSSARPGGRATADGEAPGTATDGNDGNEHVDEDAPCPRLRDTGKDVLTAAPEGVTWQLFRTVALPASKAAGPAVAGGDVARCYAHTPLGALLATSQISVRYLAADDWLKVTRAQVRGAGRESYITERTKAERKGGDDGGDGAAQGQIAGFKFVTYTGDSAVLQTVWRFSDGRMQAATTTVLWQGGDWRLEYPADPPAPTPVDSLAGYVSWGGV